MKSLKIPILLSLPLAFAQGAKAQQSPEQLDALVVESSLLDTKLNETTQSVGILTGDELEQARGQDIRGNFIRCPRSQPNSIWSICKSPDYSWSGQI